MLNIFTKNSKHNKQETPKSGQQTLQVLPRFRSYTEFTLDPTIRIDHDLKDFFLKALQTVKIIYYDREKKAYFIPKDYYDNLINTLIGYLLDSSTDLSEKKSLIVESLRFACSKEGGLDPAYLIQTDNQIHAWIKNLVNHGTDISTIDQFLKNHPPTTQQLQYILKSNFFVTARNAPLFEYLSIYYISLLFKTSIKEKYSKGYQQSFESELVEYLTSVRSKIKLLMYKLRVHRSTSKKEVTLLETERISIEVTAIIYSALSEIIPSVYQDPLTREKAKYALIVNIENMFNKLFFDRSES